MNINEILNKDKSFYDILNLPKDSSIEEIIVKCNKLKEIANTHMGSDKESEEDILNLIDKLNIINDTLTNLITREYYDAYGISIPYLLDNDTSYYDILNVSKDSSIQVIKKEYRKISMIFHPDKMTNKSDEEKDITAEVMTKINHVYRTLSTEELRSFYDKTNESIDVMAQITRSYSKTATKEDSEIFDEIFEKPTDIIRPIVVTAITKIPLKTAIFGGEHKVEWEYEDQSNPARNIKGVKIIKIPKKFDTMLVLTYDDIKLGDNTDAFLTILIQIAKNKNIVLRNEDIVVKMKKDSINIKELDKVNILGNEVSLLEPDIIDNKIVYEGAAGVNEITGNKGNIILELN